MGSLLRGSLLVGPLLLMGSLLVGPLLLTGSLLGGSPLMGAPLGSRQGRLLRTALEIVELVAREMLVYRVSKAGESHLIGVVVITDEAVPLLLGQLRVEEVVPHAVRGDRKFEGTFLGRPPDRLYEASFEELHLSQSQSPGSMHWPVSGEA